MKWEKVRAPGRQGELPHRRQVNTQLFDNEH